MGLFAVLYPSNKYHLYYDSKHILHKENFFDALKGDIIHVNMYVLQYAIVIQSSSQG